MKSNSLLRSTLWILVCLLIAGATSKNFSAMAQERTTEGALFAVSRGNIAGPCPLKHTEVKTEISGFLARVIVTQHFENPYPDKIEAVYTFPLPPAAAVDDMTIVVGNRIVKGKIMRREEAQATYDAARAKGQVAALLNQERPNIFTQAVANILPGQQIDVTISYVETLKYDEGSYEWSFPMVVGQRYVPDPEQTEASDSTAPAVNDESDAQPPTTNARVPDADRLNPPVMPKGMRAGHDISIEISIDAGVPLIGFDSKTHEIEALQPGFGRAQIRLKDQAVIPNKDFILKYDVAGAKIADALLTHRQRGDGFFTFILQPPERVTAEDVMPKELVFVLDTSGSMSGFPIAKAKETMMLALDGMYPRDTFNLITFSGETRILFPEPVPATKENVARAKKLLANLDGDGGTEMMTAIRAALKPSDAQDHVRITCFMTDGQVGNDMEIIAEVQKHKNARVFAMGFGSYPNRFLLDKITEYGRGEVEYVTENSDAKNAARRFHERVRNPLLTDVSVDWNGLPVADIYPKSIPDLFSAKPVVIFGRYTGSGKGVIRLKGMMSGREVVREIPVELSDQEPAHDVLATLWARQKIDDLMGQDMGGAQKGQMREDLKTAVTDLGLNYRLMTQYTSFVAVEDSTVTDGVEPRRVDVPVEEGSAQSAVSSGGLTETVTVSAGAEVLQTETASVNVRGRALQELAIQGRGLNGLALIAPGVSTSGGVGVSFNGQPPRSNQFIIDGIDNSQLISSSASASVAGSGPPLTAMGGTNPMVSIDAAHEVSIRTSNFSAQFGRSSGAQISVVTKSGTNDFHGSAFYFFGHEALDANDWFANSRALNKPRHRLADFGGTFGGPILRDRWFFFSSYEGLRLQQPVVGLTDVPSMVARTSAAPNVQPLLNLFPLPNGPDRSDGFAEFASAFANRGHHNAASLRIDGNSHRRLSLSGALNLTNSGANERGAGGYSLNTLNRSTNHSATVAGKLSYSISPRALMDLRVGYSHFNRRNSYERDGFGGAIVPPDQVFSQTGLVAAGASFSADLNARNARLMSGSSVAGIQRQFNTVGSIMIVKGNHMFTLGGDYRRIFPIIGLRPQEQSILFDGVTQAMTGAAARNNLFTYAPDQRTVFNEFAAYGEDSWKITSRLTLTYSLRWDLSHAPRSTSAGPFAATQTTNPAQLTFAPAGARLWRNTYGNFAPRTSVSFQPTQDEWVIRGGFGIIYDLANRAAGEVYSDSYPLLTGQSQFNVPFSFTAAPSAPSSVITVPLSVFTPNLKLPYLIEWNASVQRTLGSQQTISAAYVANAGRRLLATNTLLGQNSTFPFLRVTDNSGSSNYQSLQLQFNRQFSGGLGALVNYTWAKALDDYSDDSAAVALFRSGQRFERGPSDFDIRHSLSGALSYQLPNPFAKGIPEAVFRDWSIDALFSAHSAGPVNVVYGIPTSFGFLFMRPDLIPGVPLYFADASAAGARRINPAAFNVPLSFRQGSLGRNVLRGFPLWQANLALRREFKLTDSARLTLSAEAFNVFNHPNFGSVGGNDAVLGTRFNPGTSITVNPTFGQTFTNAARKSTGLAGSTFGPNYYPGGPRMIKLSAKFEF